MTAVSALDAVLGMLDGARGVMSCRSCGRSLCDCPDLVAQGIAPVPSARPPADAASVKPPRAGGTSSPFSAPSSFQEMTLEAGPAHPTVAGPVTHPGQRARDIDFESGSDFPHGGAR